MRFTFFKDKEVRKFSIIAISVLTLMLVLNLINHRFVMNDLKVMYLAAKSLLNHQQVYGVHFGLDSGFYKYSPFTLLFFVPYTVLPFKAAAIMHFFVIEAAIISTVVLVEQLISKYLFSGLPKTFITLFLMLFCILLHMERELYLGNTNMILLLISMLALKNMLEDNPVKSGLLWAIVVLTKPYFAVALLPLLLHRKWKLIFSTGLSMLGYVLISAILIGIKKSFELYPEWFTAMADHNSYLTSYNTVFKLLRYYFGISVAPKWYIILYAIVGIISLGVFWQIDIRNKDFISNKSRNRSILLHILLLIALAPSMLITDKEHFQFTLPLIAILILQLRNNKKPVWIGIFVLLMIMYEGNSIEVIGRHMSILFDAWGLLGIANILIMGAVLLMYSRKPGLWKLEQENSGEISD